MTPRRLRSSGTSAPEQLTLSSKLGELLWCRTPLTKIANRLATAALELIVETLVNNSLECTTGAWVAKGFQGGDSLYPYSKIWVVQELDKAFANHAYISATALTTKSGHRAHGGTPCKTTFTKLRLSQECGQDIAAPKGAEAFAALLLDDVHAQDSRIMAAESVESAASLRILPSEAQHSASTK